MTSIPGTSVRPPNSVSGLYDVYISFSYYESNEFEWVKNELIPRLKKARIKAIPGINDLGNDKWKAARLERMNECHTIIILLSNAYLSSSYASAEFINILGFISESEPQKRQAIIPVLLEKIEIPQLLIQYKTIDFTDFQNSCIRRSKAHS